MADQEERSGRKRARGDEYGIRVRIPLRRSNVSAQKGTPVSLEDLHNFGSGLPLELQSLVYITKARHARIEREEREKEGKRQKHTHSEDNENWEEGEEAYEQEHAHRLMEEAHDQHGGAGNQEAEEDHERPPRTRRRIREAGSFSPDRDEAVPDGNNEQASSDVGREATNSQARLPSYEEEAYDSTGDNKINPSREEGQRVARSRRKGLYDIKRASWYRFPPRPVPKQPRRRRQLRRMAPRSPPSQRQLRKSHARDLRDDE